MTRCMWASAVVKPALASVQQTSLQGVVQSLQVSCRRGNADKFLIAEFVQNQSVCKLKYVFQVSLCDREVLPVLLGAQPCTMCVPAAFVQE